ncbi:MAG: malto-oligosyltrehalose trehalohydrolase [Planctomycetaceae bacterium]
MPATSRNPERRLPIGAELRPDGRVDFRVWAPNCRQVEVVVPEGPRGSPWSLTLSSEPGGYFGGLSQPLEPGTRYGMRLDGKPRLWPDPASRFQPDGPAGLSQLINALNFQWTDQSWRGVTLHNQVVYEMHAGTFTPEGTWEAAAKQLGELARVGMTVIELMPVADFPGRFGWGYDGVSLFAPTRLYGTPDHLRHFVDCAHALGLGVILDVVYNHFGTRDNYLPQFSSDYISNRHKIEWGDGINFDGDNSGPVREFFLANGRYWIEEFHFDGLRFDAAQCILDESPEHILTALVRTARAAAGDRSLWIVAENEPQRVRMVRPAADGGHGMDALWNDDFHHSARVRLTGHNEAYYSDFLGSVDELLAAVKWGFLYQGQRSQWQKNSRGTPTAGLPSAGFVNFLQNHDQIANSAGGDRLDRLTSPGRLRAMTALWLLAPQTPMFFQGQEFAASTPFLYFADNAGEQARMTSEGRINFLKQFPSLATPEAVAQLCAPEDLATFKKCTLDFSERTTHAPLYHLHADLLRLRREDTVFRQQRGDRIEGGALGPDCLLLRFFGEGGNHRLLFVNFGRDLHYSPAPQPLLAPLEGHAWRLLWSSNGFEYGGKGTAALETDEGWRIPGEGAFVMAPIPGDST